MAMASAKQIPTDFCFPLRPPTSDDISTSISPSPTRRAFHSRQYTGIEVPSLPPQQQQTLPTPPPDLPTASMLIDVPVQSL